MRRLTVNEAVRGFRGGRDAADAYDELERFWGEG
jgi:hypothetical protein